MLFSIVPLKVYVTRGGQELTGQSAYRQYRKVYLKNPYINDLVFTLCHLYTLNTLGYRRVEQGLGSQKRKLIPRREKAGARCLRILSICYL